MKRKREFTASQRVSCPHWRIKRAYHRQWSCRRCAQKFVEDFYVYSAERKAELSVQDAQSLLQWTHDRMGSAEQALADVKAAFGVKKIQHLLDIAAVIQQRASAR